MNPELAAFLQRHTPATQESALWGDGTVPLVLTSYLSQELPPLAYITSVRAVMLQDDKVMVIRDPGGYHIRPGGRREANEALLETLHRELQEETGWSLSHITQIGFIHFHCLAPYRPEWPPVHPDFIQLIYTGQAEAYHPEAREKDGYELEATFRPRADLANLNLSASDLAFLDAALHVQTRA